MATTEAKRRSVPRTPGTFIDHLIKNGFPSRRPVTQDADLEVHWLDLTQLKLKTSYFTPFIVAPGLSGQNLISVERVTPIIQMIRERGRDTSSFSVLVIGGLLKDAKDLFWNHLREANVALVDKQAIDAIYKERLPEPKARHLCAAFVRSLGFEALSPYQVGRPVHGSTFFGRGRILQTILAGKRGSSYTFIGNRRIGKTSLLREIQYRLRLRNPNIRIAEIYGGIVNSTEQILSEILLRLDLSARNVADSSSIKEFFPAYIHSIADKQNQEVVAFIDELDHIIELDTPQRYEILEILRATFEHENCRIFFAGFRRTREAVKQMNTPLFNFTIPVSLSGLTQEETLKMIIQPLQLLGLDVTNDDLPMAIYRETGGQPELVQIFGQHIFSALESQGKIPSTSELLHYVLENNLFRNKMLGTFLANTPPYEELISYLLIDAMRNRPITDFEFGYDLINSLLKSKGFRLGMRELHNIVENLEVAGFIAPVKEGGKQFTFCVPQLVRYCVDMNLEVCIETALERVQTARNQEVALWGDLGQETNDAEEAPVALEFVSELERRALIVRRKQLSPDSDLEEKLRLLQPWIEAGVDRHLRLARMVLLGVLLVAFSLGLIGALPLVIANFEFLEPLGALISIVLWAVALAATVLGYRFDPLHIRQRVHGWIRPRMLQRRLTRWRHRLKSAEPPSSAE